MLVHFSYPPVREHQYSKAIISTNIVLTFFLPHFMHLGQLKGKLAREIILLMNFASYSYLISVTLRGILGFHYNECTEISKKSLTSRIYRRIRKENFCCKLLKIFCHGIKSSNGIERCRKKLKQKFLRLCVKFCQTYLMEKDELSKDDI